ncbi:ANR family transcriptional regulator [Morganella morganii]
MVHQHKKLTPRKQGKNNFQFPNHERTENFNQASVLWHEAWLLATSSANRRWCEARSQLCSQFLNIHRKTSS